MSESPPLIAIVDDDGPLLEAIDNLVQSFGFGTAPFSGGAAYLARQIHQPVDAMICDVQMPGMSGLELLDRLRERGESVPVIMITAQREETLHARIQDSGAMACLLKPFDGEMLLQMLETALAKSRSGATGV